jgi:serine/threonine-protein kinase
MNEALAEMKHASELDPLSFIITVDMAVPWAFEKKLEASAQIRKGLELEPNSSFGRWAQGWVDIEAGRIGDAIPELESARASDSAPYIAGWLGFAYAATGRRAEALKIQEQLNQSSRTNATNAPFFKAIIYLGMGDKDRALENLRKASEARSPWIIQLKVSHIYDALRSDPRFIELLKKLGLNN